MSEISDKTLVLFLVIAVIISLSGTFISISRLTKLGAPEITGLGTTGITNLTVSTTSSILVTGSIDFGYGYLNGTGNATLLSNDTNGVVDDGNATFEWSARAPMYLRIINDGNTNVSLNVSVNDTPANFLGGTGPNLQFALTDTEGGTPTACRDGSPNRDWQNLSYLQNYTVCANFTYTDSTDELNVSVKLHLPYDTPQAAKGLLIMFYADQLSD